MKLFILSVIKILQQLCEHNYIMPQIWHQRKPDVGKRKQENCISDAIL